MKYLFKLSGKILLILSFTLLQIGISNAVEYVCKGQPADLSWEADTTVTECPKSDSDNRKCDFEPEASSDYTGTSTVNLGTGSCKVEFQCKNIAGNSEIKKDELVIDPSLGTWDDTLGRCVNYAPTISMSPTNTHIKLGETVTYTLTGGDAEGELTYLGIAWAAPGQTLWNWQNNNLGYGGGNTGSTFAATNAKVSTITFTPQTSGIYKIYGAAQTAANGVWATAPYNYSYGNSYTLAVCATSETWDATLGKCSNSTLNGNLILTPPSCTILTGAQTCTVKATWNTVGVSNPKLVDVNMNTVLYPMSGDSPMPNNTTGKTVWVTGGPTGTVFDLKDDNNARLDTENATGVCEAGSTWNGTRCSLSYSTSPQAQIISASVTQNDLLNVNFNCKNSNEYALKIINVTPDDVISAQPITAGNFGSFTKDISNHDLSALLAANPSITTVTVHLRCKADPLSDAKQAVLPLSSRIAPTVTKFSGTPAEIACGGGKTTLYWDLENTKNKSCTITASLPKNISLYPASEQSSRNTNITNVNSQLSGNIYNSKSSGGNNLSSTAAFNAQDSNNHSKVEVPGLLLNYSTKFTISCSGGYTFSTTVSEACRGEQ